jgi:hypothetical protein
MKRNSDERERAQRAWERMEKLGGDGVWDNDLCAVDLKGRVVTDDDLALFRDLPMVQILMLSNTPITDSGLRHLEGLSKLELLVIANTKVTSEGLDRLRKLLPDAKITTEERAKKGSINPFTGKPNP